MSSEYKPAYSFEETSDKATFVLVIDELSVERKITKMFKKKPANATIYDKEIGSQSLNVAIRFNQPQKVYRFQIKRLPTAVNVEKSKLEFEDGRIIITLVKMENEAWKVFSDTDFETIHLVKN